LIYGLIPRKARWKLVSSKFIPSRVALVPGDDAALIARKNTCTWTTLFAQQRSNANDVPAVCICLHLAKFHPSLQQSFTAPEKFLPDQRERERELIFGAKTNFEAHQSGEFFIAKKRPAAVILKKNHSSRGGLRA
jgi:hypothetical protein